jgi:argininosuccinate synthase
VSRIVLAYSGGLDTSVLLKKLIAEGNEVIALTADVGESDASTALSTGSSSGDPGAELRHVREKAIALGAADAVVADVRERFVEEYVYPALRANAKYQGVYPLSAALSRPLIGALLVETAHALGADTVAHGCTGKGNDQVRIELAVRALDPHLKARAPLREQPLSRPDAMAYAREHGIDVKHTAEKPYSIDANLWGRSIEAGILEDPWNAPPEDAYAWTAAPPLRPVEPEEIVIHFEGGRPSIGGSTPLPNGRSAHHDNADSSSAHHDNADSSSAHHDNAGGVHHDNAPEMIALLNVTAGKHGIGRIDMVEDRVIGMKSREVYEAPAATVLLLAHQTLERLVLTRDELRFKAVCDQKYGELTYDGLWMSPLRDALDAFNASSAARVTGDVRVRLHQGVATVTGVRSPFALYEESLATYGHGDAFDHHAADGFIRLHGLPLDVLAKKRPLDGVYPERASIAQSKSSG